MKDTIIRLYKLIDNLACVEWSFFFWYAMFFIAAYLNAFLLHHYYAALADVIMGVIYLIVGWSLHKQREVEDAAAIAYEMLYE